MPRPWPLLVAVAAVAAGLVIAVVAPLSLLSLTPAPLPQLALGSGTCAVPIGHGPPPGGAAVPQPLGPGANVAGPGVRNPELSAPESYEQLNEIQLRNARTIVRAGREVGANDKALVIALMAAMVETRLYNLASDAPEERESLNYPNDGVSVDHRSVGMFQQQHWHGTPAERMDVANATRLFLVGRKQPNGVSEPPGLFDKPGWEQLDAGYAAQLVQRSAFPGRYAHFEEFAQRLLARIAAEGGAPLAVPPAGCGPQAYAGAAFGPTPPWLSAMLPGVQPDTLLAATAVAGRFPLIKVYGGVRPDSLPYHPSGRGLDIMISSAFADIRSPEAVAYGNQIADLLVQQHAELGVDHLIWNARIWSAGRAAEGWRDCASASCYAGPDDTAAHRDHVHVTTFGNAARGLPMPAALPPGSGRAAAPVPPGYPPRHSFGRTGAMWSSRHTGEDFSAPMGTPVFAVLDGVVAPPIPQGWNGNHVVLAHAGGIHTHYAHLSVVTVQPGQQVRAGQQIGLVGSTGNSTGPHLHLEYYPAGVRPGDVYAAQDPLAWLLANGVRFG